VAVLSLARHRLNTAIFTPECRPAAAPAVPEPDRLVQLWESTARIFPKRRHPINFRLARTPRSFEGMAAVLGLITNLTGLGDPLALTGMQVSPEFFSILQVSPVLGRSFIPAEGLPGQEHVAILSFGLWQSRFGGDPTVVGRKIVVDGAPNTIVGVMQRGFTLPKHTAEIWTPLPIVRRKIGQVAGIWK
jgi:putative ABC transport system permease protein